LKYKLIAHLSPSSQAFGLNWFVHATQYIFSTVCYTGTEYKHTFQDHKLGTAMDSRNRALHFTTLSSSDILPNEIMHVAGHRAQTL